MIKCYQLKIALMGSDPLVWRTVQVPATTTLKTLHQVIQTVMGWKNHHLWSFESKTRNFPMEETDISIQEILSTKGDKLRYIYDFGDYWQHKITLITTTEDSDGFILLDGANACPPEDCGGIWGYADLLEMYDNVDHPDHEDALTTLGKDFDPEQFDMATPQKVLQTMQK